MSLQQRKFEEAILYFASECQNDHLGRVKLMKLLYYLDFDHVEHHRHSVTGDTYVHLEHGPVPKSSWDIIKGMTDRLLRVEHQHVGADHPRHRFFPLRPYDPSVFSDTEQAELAAVATKWRDATSGEIERASHAELPWLLTKEKQEVPYMTAFHRRPMEPPADEVRGAILESVISSMAAEGIDVDECDARRWFAEAERNFFSSPSAQ